MAFQDEWCRDPGPKEPTPNWVHGLFAVFIGFVIVILIGGMSDAATDEKPYTGPIMTEDEVYQEWEADRDWAH